MNLKDEYELWTIAGMSWGYATDINGIITGFVRDGGVEYPVTWIRDFRGNLSSQCGRCHDIRRRRMQEIYLTIPREFNVPFIPHEQFPVKLSYSILLPAKLILLGADECTVALLINDQERARVSNKMILGVGLAVNDERDPVKTLAGTAPAGATVEIRVLSQSTTAEPPRIEAWEERIS